MDIIVIFQIIILIFSVVIHEVAHGYAALWMGDVTAKYADRLNLNPIKHLDPVGSVVLPILMALSGTGFIIGWAKPVPYNPYNLRNKRWGELIVAAAGPISNISIAVLLSVVIRLNSFIHLPSPFIFIIGMAIIINLALAIFNLIPIPPLDGSKILFNLFPIKTLKMRTILEQYPFVFLIAFVIFFSKFLVYPIFWTAEILTGLNLF